MHQILPKPDWPRLSLFENSKLFRSEFGSFDRLIDPDHKTLISEEALGIGNHLIFGISRIGPLSFEKINLEICDRSDKIGFEFTSVFELFDRLIDPDRKTLNYEERLGIGNHQIFGIN